MNENPKNKHLTAEMKLNAFVYLFKKNDMTRFKACRHTTIVLFKVEKTRLHAVKTDPNDCNISKCRVIDFGFCLKLLYRLLI